MSSPPAHTVQHLSGEGATSLAMGQEITVLTFSGRARVHITALSSQTAYAEDEFNVYPLRFEDGFWVCDSAWSKKGLKEMGAYLAREIGS